MFYSFRKLRNDYLKSVETKDFDKCFQDHTEILLQNKKDLYAAQRTILSLRHRMFMGLGNAPTSKTVFEYCFGKFKLDKGGSLKSAPDDIKTGLHFSKDGGIMDGTFHANGDLKTGVYFHLYGVVEEGSFQNNVLTNGLRICENGDFEEGTFVDGIFTSGLRYRPDGLIEQGAFTNGVLTETGCAKVDTS